MIRRWRELERWIEDEAADERTSAYPMLPMKEVLTERREPVQLDGALGDWQPITIKFSGEVLPRGRGKIFKGAMFAAYPGDLVFSKIDARNGAIGLIPASIPKAIVTSEYPVLIPDEGKLRPEFLNYLLRAKHFKASLRRKASGTSGRKRVTPEGFLSLTIPVPDVDSQDELLKAYKAAIDHADKLDQEAQHIEAAGFLAFEAALGVAPPPSLPDRPIFVARFKEIERWSHDGILRVSSKAFAPTTPTWPLVRLGDVVDDLENGWSPKCHKHLAREGKWGVLKVGAVSFGTFDDSQNKELPDRLNPRIDYEVKSGDVLISRANVARYVGACAYVEKTRPNLLLCDKIFRVIFRRESRIVPQFLAEAMRLPTVREQIETKLTGMSPTMKNISKPALLDLRFPLPEIEDQKILIDSLTSARQAAATKRSEAIILRELAWTSFEKALFIAHK